VENRGLFGELEVDLVQLVEDGVNGRAMADDLQRVLAVEVLAEAVCLEPRCTESAIKFLCDERRDPLSNAHRLSEEEQLKVCKGCYLLFSDPRSGDRIKGCRAWDPLYEMLSCARSERLQWHVHHVLEPLLESRFVNSLEYFEDQQIFPARGTGKCHGSKRHYSSPYIDSMLEAFFDKDGLKMVRTVSSERNVRRTLMALQAGKPLMLHGRSGTGKSLLVHELAKMFGKKQELVELQLDDQMDSKTLFGTYVCTEVPGEFQWQPGALTQAVLNECWVFVEDIDRAPFEVLAALVPLLESRQLMLPNQNEVISAGPGFQVIATRRKAVARVEMLENLWINLDLEPLSLDELQAVSLTLKPCLSSNLIALMVCTFMGFIGETDGFPINIRRITPGRPVSERDYFKWLNRVHQVFSSWRTPPKQTSDGTVFLTEQQREDILQEALDCFVSGAPLQEVRKSIMNWLAETWAIPAERLIHRAFFNKPQVLADEGSSKILVGRTEFNLTRTAVVRETPRKRMAPTGVSMRILEQVAVCVKMCEPVLLIGETGAGKTATIQELAARLEKRLVVQNMHIQSDGTELLGGYKPVQLSQIATPLYERFVELFLACFPQESNQKFLDVVRESLQKLKWKKLSKAFTSACVMASKQHNGEGQESDDRSKRRKIESVQADWIAFEKDASQFENLRRKVEQTFAFTFQEGALVKALRNGDWVLLDEVNLASGETLERLNSLLDGSDGSLFLTERGDMKKVERHPGFRIFAAMNPATDAGKKDLPPALRARFTELFVDEIESETDLQLITESYLSDVPSAPLKDIVEVYLDARRMSEEHELVDGADNPPRYSLRTLCRALSSTRTFLERGFGLSRALYESFTMTFATVLEQRSFKALVRVLRTRFVPNVPQAALKTAPRCPGPKSHRHNFVLCDRFWIKKGPLFRNAALQNSDAIKSFVLTPSVTQNVQALARAVVAAKFPVLLQGPTSSGKTTMVAHLAAKTGHKCVRINNHEHTDLQEYMGSYVTDESGKLVFREGVLVEAVRNGHWVVLDELNLAPSEVLEALNRLLDDNRELFIPETQTVVQPHPDFLLFATQNPPGLYGGRKMLSQAFRNRFLEVHVGEIPSNELETILNKRCALAPSFCKVLVTVMNELQLHREKAKLFAGKEGFITPRDLLRWASRNPQSYEELAIEGYRLLGDRARISADRAVVKSVLEKHCKTELTEDNLYPELEPALFQSLRASPLAADAGISRVILTDSMRRLYSLVRCCVKNKEPVLLVGETGCGKTTVCQLLALETDKELEILNCHQHTDTADILGSLRPIRNKRNQERKLVDLATSMNPEFDLRNDLMDLETLIASQSDQHLELKEAIRSYRAFFEWHDGPLIRTMKNGSWLLLDEISLAEDAVIERLNSVLEPSRSVLLAEKGGEENGENNEIIAHDGFRVLATMNPGGDYGKRELSPALRNRFTEVWIPNISQTNDLKAIVEAHLSDVDCTNLVEVIVRFFVWFNEEGQGDTPLLVLTLRDLISWCRFITKVKHVVVSPWSAFLHGAGLVLLDGLGLGSGVSSQFCLNLRRNSYKALKGFVPEADLTALQGDFLLGAALEDRHVAEERLVVDSRSSERYGIAPFFIQRRFNDLKESFAYSMTAPTTSINLARVLRAMQLERPILLEGSPGVGKTSLITALAERSGHTLVRINLSEQTDFSDLIGADIPDLENASSSWQMTFKWSDGVFLSALKAGDWILLDELNLASQSVLEGLNSCLDHRGTVFIPELNRSFACARGFRVFAAQNPLQQGGGRKGLPKSFLNRFTKVYVDPLHDEDYRFILEQVFPSLERDFVRKLVLFNEAIVKEIVEQGLYGRAGSPWEFNLRDMFRVCEVGKNDDIVGKLLLIYESRLRTKADRKMMRATRDRIFGTEVPDRRVEVRVMTDVLYVGSVQLPRSSEALCNCGFFPRAHLNTLEGLAQAVAARWPALVVGGSGTGKSSLVRYLSKLCGQNLHEMTVTSATDASELLGCFEQADVKRSFRSLIKECRGLVEVILKRFCSQDVVGDFLTTQLTRLERIRHALVSEREIGSQEAVKQALNTLSECQLLASERAWMHQVEALLEKYLLSLKSQVPGSFEWVDGTLLRALVDGEWVVINNANLCSPTVLDRLNPVLETNGELLVNECGMVNGKPRIVKPHKNFRIFFVVDPAFGEVSRALRNRCLEIALPESPLSDMIESGDAARMLAMAAVPHDAAQSMLKSDFRSPLFLHNWAEAFRVVDGLGDPSCSLEVALRESYNLAADTRFEKVPESTQLLPDDPGAFCLIDFPWLAHWVSLSWEGRLIFKLHGKVDKIRALIESTPSSWNLRAAAFSMNPERIFDELRHLCLWPAHEQELVGSHLLDPSLRDAQSLSRGRLASLIISLNALEEEEMALCETESVNALSIYHKVTTGDCSREDLLDPRILAGGELLKALSAYLRFLAGKSELLDTLDELFLLRFESSQIVRSKPCCDKASCTSLLASVSLQLKRSWKIAQKLGFASEFEDAHNRMDRLLGDYSSVSCFDRSHKKLPAGLFKAFKTPCGNKSQRAHELLRSLRGLSNAVVGLLGHSLLTAVQLGHEGLLISIKDKHLIVDAMCMVRWLQESHHEIKDARKVSIVVQKLWSTILERQKLLREVPDGALKSAVDEWPLLRSEEFDEKFVLSSISTAKSPSISWGLLQVAPIVDSWLSRVLAKYMSKEPLPASLQMLVEYVTERSTLPLHLVAPFLELAHKGGAEEFCITMEQLHAYYHLIWASWTERAFDNDPFSHLQNEGYGGPFKDIRDARAVNFGSGPVQLMENGALNFVMEHLLFNSGIGFDANKTPTPGLVRVRERLMKATQLRVALSQTLMDLKDKDTWIQCNQKVLWQIFVQLMSGIGLEIEEIVDFDAVRSRIAELPYLPAAVEILSSSWPRLSAEQLGQLWIFLSLFRLEIFAPVSPIDPNFKHVAKVEALSASEKKLNEDLDAIRYEDKVVGLANGPVEHWDGPLSKQLGRIGEDKVKATKKLVYRDASSRVNFETVYELMKNLRGTICSDKRMNDLMHSIRENRHDAEGREGMLIQSLGQAIERLSGEEYACMQDVVLPLIIALRELQMGFQMLGWSIRKRESNTTKARRLIGSFPLHLQQDTAKTQIESLCSWVLHQGKLPEAVWRHGLVTVFFKMASSIRFHQHQPESWFAIEDVVNRFASIFVEKKKQERKEEREKEELYRFKTREHLADDQPEHVRLQEELRFREMFPDFHAEFQSKEKDEEVEGEREMEDKTVINSALDGNEREVLKAIFDLFQKRQMEPAWHRPALEHAFKTVHLLQDKSSPGDGISGLALFGLADAFCACNAYDIEKATEKDLYHDSFVSELLLLEEPLRTLESRVQFLLAEFPDNAILLHITKLINKLLDLALSTCLMRALVGVEMLLKVANDWELVAHKKVSLETELKGLVRLVFRWRKIELDSWPRVVLSREENAQEEARFWFFQLYGLCLGECASEEEKGDFFEELSKSLDQFLRTATLGCFSTRIETLNVIIEILKRRLSSTEKEKKLQNLLAHLMRYYSQWANDVDATRERKCAAVKRKLKDEIKLARWDDRNYYTLKESADKSHRLLHKLSREVDGLLAEVAFPTFEAAVNQRVGRREQASRDSHDTVLVELDDVRALKSPPPIGFTLSFSVKGHTMKHSSPQSIDWGLKRTRNLPKLLSRMEKILQKDVKDKLNLQEGFGKALEMPENLNSAIFGRIGSLRNGKAPQVAKQRAFADLLKELRNQGLSRSSNPSRGQVVIEELVLRDVFEFDSFMETGHKQKVLDSAQRSDSKFYQVLANLQRLRSSIIKGEVSPDVGVFQMSRALHFAEHLFEVICDSRDRLICSLRSRRALKHSIASIRCLEDFANTQYESLRDLRKRMSHHCDSACQMLAEIHDLCRVIWNVPNPADITSQLRHLGANATLATLHICDTADPKLRADADAQFAELEQICEDSSKKLLHGIMRPFVTRTEKSELEALPEYMNELRSKFSQLEKCLVALEIPVPAICQEVELLLSLMDEEAMEIESKLEAMKETSPEGSLDSAVENSLNAVLLVIQDVRKCALDFEEDGKGGSIMETSSSLCKICEATSFERLKVELETLVEVAVTCQEELPIFVHTNILEALERIDELGELLEAESVAYLERLCRLEFLLLRVFRSIASNGFCKTKEEEENTGDDNADDFKEGEGTGMGDGEGRQDVTDEIEDEEQLLGQKKEEGGETKEERKEIEEKKGDDGMEMENEFEGDVFDVKQESENENDSKDDDDDEEELDREMGDLDEDQNVVDEKLWDGADDDEDAKEQKEEDKFENDAPMEGDDGRDELRAKDEDEGEKEKEDKTDEDQENKGPQSSEFLSDDENELIDDAENVEDRHENLAAKEDEDVEEEKDIPENLQIEDDEEESEKEEENGEGEKEKERVSVNDEDEDEDDMSGEEHDKEHQVEAEEGEEVDETEKNDGAVSENDHDDAKGDNENEPDAAPASRLETQDSEEGARDDRDRAFGSDAPKAGEEDSDSAENDERQSASRSRSNENEKESAKEHQRSSFPVVQDYSDGPEESSNAKETPKMHESAPEDDSRQQSSKKSQERPNPWRDPQKAMEQWRRRLQILEDGDERPLEDGDQDDKDVGQEDDGAKSVVDEDEKFKFSNTETQATTQALAPSASAEVDTEVRPEEENEDNEMHEEEEEGDDDGGSLKRKASDDEAGSDLDNHGEEEEEALRGQRRKRQKTMIGPEKLAIEDEDVEEEEEEGFSNVKDSINLEDKRAVIINTQDDLKRHIAEVEAQKKNWDDVEPVPATIPESDPKLWLKLTSETSEASQHLCEQLRLLLEPSLATRLQGDYRSGKRINMRRVIPYIASQFRKDKIWLRRTKPSKREYQVVLALDNSRSMKSSGRLALSALVMLCNALSKLEVGQVGVLSFGENVEILNRLDQPFTDSCGAGMVSAFSFSQEKTAIEEGLIRVVEEFQRGRESPRNRGTHGIDFRQLAFFISDGRFDSAVRDRVRRLVREAVAERILVVLVIVETSGSESIIDTKQVKFDNKGKVRMSRYLDDYPFPLYIILEDMNELPATLADGLRQWFELLSTRQE